MATFCSSIRETLRLGHVSGIFPMSCIGARIFRYLFHSYGK
ncbi:hypothetical protein HMPREF0281_01793 [Corynebacterium ammoniagenes DSM 20306]|uniref:Uncharacterized protein n=1 Tax=Corynebacterium ammoniagenes DSM 20306 TaxID=649754 RepID=A0ABN0ADX5_CORAM|nr:hypothetical protein HMPREF0281_01793 [Corynebacterium ammoniagenes DSM 20306]